MKKIALGKFDPEKLKKLNQIVLQDGFTDRLNEVRKVNLTILQKPTWSGISVPQIPSNGELLLDNLEDIRGYKLNPERGNSFSKEVGFAGYDETKFQFHSLEGEAHIFGHAIANYVNQEIFPISKISFHFYTRSNILVEQSQFIKYTDDVLSESNRDYVLERNEVLDTFSLNDTVLFIDGPMIGGNITSYTLKLIKALHSKNVIPIFIVKNSNSNLVVENVDSFQKKYNSDLHWSYQLLANGERSNIFKYTDQHNTENTKLFYYLKPFANVTPQRIEFHPETYFQYTDYMSPIHDLIYYLLLVHGDRSNPQIRPIAVAEKYAREVIRTVNVEMLLKKSSLVQTMDQSRFGG